MGETLVIVPTYDERDSIVSTVARTLSATDDSVDLLIVDDDSPDGTGEIAERLASGEPRVHVLHRQRKEGLGPAYVAGFEWALAAGYDRIVEMDADGSHLPEHLPRLLERLDGADLVLGSRWIPGARVEHWPRWRMWLSRGGNRYARTLLRLPVADATGGYRAFRADALRGLRLDEVASQGYCFQVDVLRRVLAAGGSVVEEPIIFVERVHGRSKMSGRIVLEALLRVTAWGVGAWWGRVRGRVARPIGSRHRPGFR